jgi:hypothetical protein
LNLAIGAKRAKLIKNKCAGASFVVPSSKTMTI